MNKHSNTTFGMSNHRVGYIYERLHRLKPQRPEQSLRMFIPGIRWMRPLQHELRTISTNPQNTRLQYLEF